MYAFNIFGLGSVLDDFDGSVASKLTPQQRRQLYPYHLRICVTCGTFFTNL
jgi:hypothetical protein